MTAIAIAESSLAALKKALRTDLPDIRSSHLTEAMAAALDFRTHASLIAALPEQASDPSILLLDNERFEARLSDFGYQLADDEFRFEWLFDCVDSGPSQSPRPIRHEQSAQFAMSRSPEYHEQHSRSGTAHAQQRNDAHERCYA